jgi:hypothetical protein
MKLLCTKLEGTNPSYVYAKIEFVVVFEKKRFEAKVDSNV